MADYEFGEVCLHGRLARKCEVCELNEQVAELTQERDVHLRACDVAIDVTHDLQARLDAAIARAERAELANRNANGIIGAEADLLTAAQSRFREAAGLLRRLIYQLPLPGASWAAYITEVRAFLAAPITYDAREDEQVARAEDWPETTQLAALQRVVDAARVVVACGGVSDEDVALEAALDALDEKEVKP